MKVPTFKIEGVERVREGTHKVHLDAGREGKLRVVVYPNRTMLVLCDGPVQWLQSDFTPAQQARIFKAVESGDLGY